MSSSEHCRRAIFQIYNVKNLKITRITTFRIRNVVYQAGSRWDPKCVFNFLRFFERTLYKSNYIIFILSWCGTHTKIRSKLVDIVTAGWQKITLWGPHRTSLGILRVNRTLILSTDSRKILKYQTWRKYVQWEPSCSVWADGRTDEQTDAQTNGRTDGFTDRQTHEEANGRFSQFYERAKKKKLRLRCIRTEHFNLMCCR